MTLASGQNNPQAIAVDATSVYWADDSPEPGTGSIMKVALDGGGTPSTLAQQYLAGGIAINGSELYWAAPTGVVKLSVDGGAPVTVVSSGQHFAEDVAVDGKSIYWTTAGGLPKHAGTVMRAGLVGGSPVTLASGQDSPAALDVGADSVYWVNWASAGTVMKVPVGGGSAEVLASAQSGPVDIALDATSVYWDDSGNGVIMKGPRGGGAPGVLASALTPQGIAVDGGNVYCACGYLVLKVPISGGNPVLLATSQSAWGIAIDDTSVYWTNTLDGTVMKLTPK